MHNSIFPTIFLILYHHNQSKTPAKLHIYFFLCFFASRGALRNHSPSAPTSPCSGKPLPFFDFRRGMGMDFGLQTGRKLVGRHRDLNPGPPAWESGVLAITLRGPPPNFSWYCYDCAIRFTFTSGQHLLLPAPPRPLLPVEPGPWPAAGAGGEAPVLPDLLASRKDDVSTPLKSTSRSERGK